MPSSIPEEAVLAKLAPEQRLAHSRLQLSSCLQAFSAPESLDGDDAYHCEACAKKAEEQEQQQQQARERAAAAAMAAGGGDEPKAAEASAGGAGGGSGGSNSSGNSSGSGSAQRRGQPALKWLQVSRKPNALTLHLKRFRSSGQFVHKLDAHVPFPTTLDLAPFTTSSGRSQATHYTQLQPAPADGSSCYRLYGVVEHQGSFKGGHYVAFVKASPSGVWHRMSDSTVSRVDEETALKAQAFLLFYELVK
jgi:ubiquitin carboxyl-terminal hydrolase 16/45